LENSTVQPPPTWTRGPGQLKLVRGEEERDCAGDRPILEGDVNAPPVLKVEVEELFRNSATSGAAKAKLLKR
jgi:hypothetical protein